MSNTGFKVGDKVLRTTPRMDEPRMRAGNIYTVSKVRNMSIEVAEVPGDVFWMSEFFNLVAPSPLTELDTLVATANAGYAAMRKLRDIKEEVEITRELEDQWTSYSHYAQRNYVMQVRIKPKKKEFTPFTLKEGYEISLEAGSNETVVRVGCQSFQFRELRSALRALCKENKPNYPSEWCTRREGIQYQQHKISWESADQLLKALEEYEAL